MPKIDVDVVPDKTGDDDADWDICDWRTESARCIKDLLFVQNDKKMYINEKKQIQALINKLHTCGFYAENETVLDKIGLIKVN